MANYPLHQRVYIVGIPNGDIVKEAHRVQKLLETTFGIYQGTLPTLHMTMAVAAAPALSDIDKICQAVERFAATTTTINIRASEYTCIPRPQNAFAMAIENTPHLRRSCHKLHHHLSQNGLALLSNADEWVFHITLISKLFSKNPLPDFIYSHLCRKVRRPFTNLSGSVSLIGVWRPDIKNRDIAYFPLRTLPVQD